MTFDRKPPFRVDPGCENYHVTDDNGERVCTVEADFDTRTHEFSGQAEAQARAEFIADALNVVCTLGKLKGLL